MAVKIKEKSVKIGDRFIGSITICYLPLFDGKLESTDKNYTQQKRKHMQTVSVDIDKLIEYRENQIQKERSLEIEVSDLSSRLKESQIELATTKNPCPCGMYMVDGACE